MYLCILYEKMQEIKNITNNNEFLVRIFNKFLLQYKETALYNYIAIFIILLFLLISYEKRASKNRDITT